jgi:hypothetical protein
MSRWESNIIFALRCIRAWGYLHVDGSFILVAWINPFAPRSFYTASTQTGRCRSNRILKC